MSQFNVNAFDITNHRTIMRAKWDPNVLQNLSRFIFIGD